MTKMYALIVLVFAVMCTGCSTAELYRDQQALKPEGERESFVGWLFKPASEMTPEELAQAQALDKPNRTYSPRVRARVGPIVQNDFEEELRIRRGPDGRTRTYSYRYDIAVGGGADIKFRYSPRPKDGYYSDRREVEKFKERNRNR